MLQNGWQDNDRRVYSLEVDSPTLLAWSTTVATIGLLVVTAIYCYFTYQLADVARRQIAEAVKPRIGVAVVATQRGQFFVLGIDNVGVSPALDFEARLDRDVHRTYGDQGRLNDIPIFKETLPALMPRTPVDIGLGVSFTYLADDADRGKHPKRFSVEVTYKFEGKTHAEVMPLEIHDLYAETMISHTEMSDLVKAVKDEIGKPLKETLRELKRLQQ